MRTQIMLLQTYALGKISPKRIVYIQDQTARPVQLDLYLRYLLKGQRIALKGQRVQVGIVPAPFTTVHALEKFLLNKDQLNKRTMMVLYRSPEHICNLYGLSRAGY